MITLEDVKNINETLNTMKELVEQVNLLADLRKDMQAGYGKAVGDIPELYVRRSDNVSDHYFDLKEEDIVDIRDKRLKEFNILKNYLKDNFDVEVSFEELTNMEVSFD